MSFTFRSINLQRVQATLNEWIDRETRPITWHKLQLFFSKLSLDLERSQSVNVQDMGAGLVTLTADAPVHQFLDAGGGAADLDMPAEVEVAGVRWAIRVANTSDAAETITVDESDSTTNIGTVAQNETKWVIWDGTAWQISPA